MPRPPHRAAHRRIFGCQDHAEEREAQNHQDATATSGQIDKFRIAMEEMANFERSRFASCAPFRRRWPAGIKNEAAGSSRRLLLFHRRVHGENLKP